MKTRGQRLRAKTPKSAVAVLPRPVSESERPAWTDDPRERLKRLPPLQALREVGLLDAAQLEAGRRFGVLYQLAAENRRQVTPRYGAAGGRGIDEVAQDAARKAVAAMLKRVCPYGNMLIAVAADDERPPLTDVPRLRDALDRISTR